MKQSTSRRVVLNIQSFSRSLCNQLFEQFLEVQELVNPEGTNWDTGIAKDLPRSETVSDGDLERSAQSRPQLVKKVTNAELLDAAFALVGSCNGMSDTIKCPSSSSCVKSTVGTHLPTISSSLLGS